MKKLVFILTTFAALTFNQTATAQGTIVDVAAGNGDFSTLVTALKSADLVSSLQGSGPFTVFAPTNSAFEKLGSETLTSLLEPSNKDMLSGILTYHVVSGKLTAADIDAAVKKGEGKAELVTLNGNILTLVEKDGKIWLQDQKGNYSGIISADVMASNGVIHAISDVVMP